MLIDTDSPDKVTPTRRGHRMRIKALMLAGMLAAGSWVSDGAAAPPATRLYVRTIPSGATVQLDGKEVGQSDGLFTVQPGTHTVRVELDGQTPHESRLDVAAGQITRLVVEFQALPAASTRPARGEDGGDAGGRALAGWLARSDVDSQVRQAMLTVLRQHPDQTRWSGRSGGVLFGLACKRMPTGPAGDQAGPAVMNLTHLLAVQELLKAKSLLDQYASAGLTDASTLGQALAQAAGKFRVEGEVKSFHFKSAVHEGWATAYVLAQEQDLAAHLQAPASVETVRLAYRDAMHLQARELMKRGNHADALLLWKHLHSRKLVSQGLYLDAARCFVGLGQQADALRMLSEAVDAFAESGAGEFFEQAGDLALTIDLPAAQELAEKAYRRASQELLNVVTPATQPANDVPLEPVEKPQ